MRDWKQIAVDSGIQVYFCDPHAPWQRGSNENTNGLLRQYFPKGFDFATVTEADLDKVADELNDRPRKRLDFYKPSGECPRNCVGTNERDVHAYYHEKQDDSEEQQARVGAGPGA